MIKLRGLVLVCIEANFCTQIFFEIYKIYTPLHHPKLNISAILSNFLVE